MSDKASGPAAGTTTVDILTSAGVLGAGCLTAEEQEALGNLTLNELKGIAKAQKLLKGETVPSGVCGGKVF